ncbi:hypothetical protein HOD88_01115 [archaeon]|jgi:hypothetical protein|nr:hypothetical protein [archaeon]
MTLKEYVKTVMVNPATLIGHLGTASIALGSILENTTDFDASWGLYAAVAIPSAILEFQTALGIGTYNEYHRAKRIIQNPKEPPKKVLNSYEKNANYCNRVGAHLAYKEAGLEEAASQLSLNPLWRFWNNVGL